MRKPDWICEDTHIETTNHPTAEVWIEEHENPENGETVYLVCDTSGSDYGHGSCGLVGVYDSFEDASNRIGDEFGYDKFWKKF